MGDEEGTFRRDGSLKCFVLNKTGFPCRFLRKRFFGQSESGEIESGIGLVLETDEFIIGFDAADLNLAYDDRRKRDCSCGGNMKKYV